MNQDCVPRWKPNEEFNRHWFAQIALALAYIHSKAILHKDIAERNIFVQYSDPNLQDLEERFMSSIVKLGDFGISEDLSKGYKLEALRQKLKKDIFDLGEVLRGISVDRSDLLEDLLSKMTTAKPLKTEKILKHPWLQANRDPRTERFIWRSTGYRESRFDPLNQKWVKGF